MKENRIKYFIAAITATALWGFFSIPLRMLKAYPSDEILHYRILTSLSITWLVIALFRKQKLKEDIARLKGLDTKQRKRILALTLVAGVLVTANWFTFIYAVNHVSLTSAAFAYMVCPLLTAMGGFILLKEHLTPIKLIAIGIALISILILAQGSLRDVWWSVLIASLYAGYLLIQRVVVEIDKFNMLGVQLILSTLIMLPFFFYHHASFPWDAHFWAVIVVISVVFTIIPLFLSLYSLIGLPSSTMGILIYANPLVAFAVAIFYFKESINQQQLLAYLLLLLAVIVFNWALLASLLSKYKKQAS
ncbi:MAG: EamA family transporter [Sphingobacteriaceae bacterium]